ncbi:acyl-CoA dehydrogenase family protein [Salinibacillus xinjiangensis]|uniref:Acyl-CoA dehydrogenase n=1 Tax=Salinibacillus xinjiangensis TaxID=1229268 RepID=A0A6G1X1K5_9BACI|nr:acyl-CoA dehydrogenase family protein [Salinibacillus xinjiangensis]MRG84877.1 acyl-CoA dehydrogenase [Salinibacillus xinjiangensis]
MDIYKHEHNLFRKSFRKFLQEEIVPFHDKWEEIGAVPKEIWHKLGRYGFLCPWVEEKYGGFSTGFEYSAIIIEELGKAAVDIAIPLHSDVVTPYISKYGTEEQKQKWLPKCVSGEVTLSIGITEPNTGSDVSSITTYAKKDGDTYIINGQKVYISNGLNSGATVLACKTSLNEEKPHKGISLIIVEEGIDGFTKGKSMKKLGRKASEVCELFFNDCRVPVHNLLGNEGEGFTYLMENLKQERLVQTIRSQAESEEILNLTLDYTRNRRAFGKNISSFQHNQFKLVELATEIELGRTFVDKILIDYLEGHEDEKQIAMAKWWITEMANRVAYHCLQLHGGIGYMEEYPLARRFRNARMDTIAAGTTEIMKVIISKKLNL